MAWSQCVARVAIVSFAIILQIYLIYLNVDGVSHMNITPFPPSEDFSPSVLGVSAVEKSVTVTDF
jgi:hypothetical protein